MKKKYVILIILGLVLTLSGILPGCTAKPGETKNPSANNTGNRTQIEKITIAIQYGLGYAPCQIAEEKKLIEKYLPGVEVEWKQVGNGGIIRDGMISGDIDIGFMAIPPYLIAWDQGVDWKIALALGNAPQGLQTNREGIKSLKDFKEDDKIAVPIPGSIQHILLAMAAEKELNNPKALDNNLVSMKHPDGANALINGQSIAAHFTSPPYLFEELNSENIRQIVDADEAFGGEYSFLIGLATRDFHDKHPAAYAAFIAGINEAINFINQNPKEAAAILAPKYKLAEDKVEKYLTWPGTNYTSTPYGIMGFAEFMAKTGYIKKAPESLDEVCWENVSAAIGKKSGGKSPVEKVQYRD